MEKTLADKRIVLILSGGIAAYKSLDLIRRLRERGAAITPIMTAGAQHFVTPLAVGALASAKVHIDLFDRDDEVDIGHIRLARDCDLVLVAPCTADLAAKMAHGLADDLASTVLLATNRPVLIAPAMNPVMWAAAPTQRNMNQLVSDGIHHIGPASGEMAEAGEVGIGRMAEVPDIVAAAEGLLNKKSGPLKGQKILVTAGPTHEAIDPVRYIANRSSGKQGYAIAKALAALDADVTLVSGPTRLAAPKDVTRIDVESARDMLAAAREAMPVDGAVFVAAVADWRSAGEATQKIKKDKKADAGPPPLELVENPDILATIGNHKTLRPRLVVGFAAETQNVVDNALAKLDGKGADWIVANDVSSGVMGGDSNEVHIVSQNGVEHLPAASKEMIADQLAKRIASALTLEEC